MKVQVIHHLHRLHKLSPAYHSDFFQLQQAKKSCVAAVSGDVPQRMWASRGITGLLENVGVDLGHVTVGCHVSRVST